MHENNQTINAIIVDDEPYACEALATLLEENCPGVRIIDICYSGETALQSILEKKPQLLFLDIEMPRMNGFEMLEKLEQIDFALIFTTSYNEYAIRAIKFSALDYLLKPVDREELQLAVNRAREKQNNPLPQQLQILLQKLNQPSSNNFKIALPTLEGFQMIQLDSIIRCEAESNYTKIMLSDKRKIIISRTLKDLEDLLSGHSFIRVHHSHIVNINAIEKYVKGDGGYLVMTDNSSVDVSRSRKEFVLQRLKVRH